MTNSTRLVAYLLFSSLLLSACTTHQVKTTVNTPIVQVNEEIDESLLLDIGVHIFDPGLDQIEEGEEILFFPEIRQAEARFIPVLIMETLQTSAAWGAVRVVPSNDNAVDVHLTGAIVDSDGEVLTLKVNVYDNAGNHWYSREYSELASRYDYDRKTRSSEDPFQGMYNRISNDLLRYRQNHLSSSDIATLRTISELKFAQHFSPEAFSGHLNKGSDGSYTIVRLPADSDPMLGRIRQIRERDYLFVDTLQDHYGTFVKEMETPYQAWRAQSYSEAIAMRELQISGRNRTIAGIIAIVGGIAAAGANDGAARAAAQMAVAAGGYLAKTGFDKKAEARMHLEALQELGDSLEADIEPQIIELEDRTVTLSGSVQNQYDQWRDLLRDIYQMDTGDLNTPVNASPDKEYN